MPPRRKRCTSTGLLAVPRAARAGLDRAVAATSEAELPSRARRERCEGELQVCGFMVLVLVPLVARQGRGEREGVQELVVGKRPGVGVDEVLQALHLEGRER